MQSVIDVDRNERSRVWAGFSWHARYIHSYFSPSLNRSPLSRSSYLSFFSFSFFVFYFPFDESHINLHLLVPPSLVSRLSFLFAYNSIFYNSRQSYDQWAGRKKASSCILTTLERNFNFQPLIESRVSVEILCPCTSTKSTYCSTFYFIILEITISWSW